MEGTPLVHGACDDTQHVIATRLAIYRREGSAVVDHYARHGILIEVDGTPSPFDVSSSICGRLEARALRR